MLDDSYCVETTRRTVSSSGEVRCYFCSKHSTNVYSREGIWASEVKLWNWKLKVHSHLQLYNLHIRILFKAGIKPRYFWREFSRVTCFLNSCWENPRAGLRVICYNYLYEQVSFHCSKHWKYLSPRGLVIITPRWNIFHELWNFELCQTTTVFSRQ